MKCPSFAGSFKKRSNIRCLVRALEAATPVVSLLLVALAPSEDLPRLHDVSVSPPERGSHDRLGKPTPCMVDEFHLQVNRQYVKGASSGIRQIAVMTKRESFDSKSVRVFTLTGTACRRSNDEG